VLSVDGWAEIRRLHRSEGLSIRTIARVRGVSRNTVRNALKGAGAAALSTSSDGVAGGSG
jgi:lambda repressor-like predicted transcriptional regulator